MFLATYWPLYLQEKEEKLDSDASLNKFFQDIYQDYDDDVRRAMAKSFVRTTYSCFQTILRYQPQLDLFLLQPCFFIRLYLHLPKLVSLCCHFDITYMYVYMYGKIVNSVLISNIG